MQQKEFSSFRIAGLTASDASIELSDQDYDRGFRVKSFLRNQLVSSPGLWIPVLYVITLLVVSPLHNRFDEWGGVMQFFAGKEILAGRGYNGWASYFWPPLYSVLIGLGSLVGPGFFVGKLISIVAGTALLYVAYALAIELTGQKRIAVLSQVFLFLTPLYFKESLIAHNHMLDAFLFVSGLWLFLRSLREPSPGRLLVVGLICGLAGLSRYTSYVLLALPLFLVIVVDLKTAIKLALAFWGGFFLVSLPWWYYNTVTNGLPFYTRQELNICMEVVPGVWGGGSNLGLWECNLHYNFHSIFEVIAAYPVGYLRNFYQNIIESVVWLVKLPPNILALFVIPAILESFISMKPRFWIILFGELALFIGLASQALVPEYALLPWAPLITIVTITFIFRYFDLGEVRYPILQKYHARTLFLALVIMVSLALLPVSKINYPQADAALVDLGEVAQVLKEHDPNIAAKVVMAVDPARAYYAGSKYLATPLEYEGTVDGLVSYRDLSERVKIYAPKYPSTIANSELRADYLIYTRPPEDAFLFGGQQYLPQFSFLLNPKSEQIPENFKLVYCSDNVAVYEIDWSLNPSGS